MRLGVSFAMSYDYLENFSSFFSTIDSKVALFWVIVCL